MSNKVSRQIKWVAAVSKENEAALNVLESRMGDFYANSDTYYSDIDFNYNIWEDASQLAQQDMLGRILRSESVLEVGCGKANILVHNEALREKYTGIDFSPAMMAANSKKFPKATFKAITNSKKIDFPDNHFSLVFSHFVIEHSVYPHIFLQECVRVLKPGGTLLLLCPNFLGNAFIPSQRVGYSQGSGRDKLKLGRPYDALVTGFDSKIRLPLVCAGLRKKAQRSPQFYINTNPACFVDKFQPDVDAVYLTFEPEMKAVVQDSISWESYGKEVHDFTLKSRTIYLVGTKINKR